MKTIRVTGVLKGFKQFDFVFLTMREDVWKACQDELTCRYTRYDRNYTHFNYEILEGEENEPRNN